MSKFKTMAKQFYKDWYSGGPYEIIQGTRSGFDDLDYATEGFRPGELIMVASRPAMGKTSFALNMVDNISVRGDGSALYLTNDCSEQVIADRLIQIHAGVSGINYRKFEFYDEEEMALDSEKKALTHAKVDIRNITGVSVSCLEDIVRNNYLKHPLDLLVVDNYKILKEADNSADQFIFSELKRIAEKNNVPVIILCPLSRAVEEREDYHPTIADVEIKDAVTLSDFVLFLYRENYYKPTEDTSVPMEIDIVKTPRGRRVTVVLKTYTDCFTMVDYSGVKHLEMCKKYEDNHFNYIFDRWQEILSSLESKLAKEEYSIYINPLELQTISDKPIVLTVIVPEEADINLYEDKYKTLLLQAIHDVSDLSCKDIYFVTQSEIDEYYEECEIMDNSWGKEQGDDCKGY